MEQVPSGVYTPPPKREGPQQAKPETPEGGGDDEDGGNGGFWCRGSQGCSEVTSSNFGSLQKLEQGREGSGGWHEAVCAFSECVKARVCHVAGEREGGREGRISRQNALQAHTKNGRQRQRCHAPFLRRFKRVMRSSVS